MKKIIRIILLLIGGLVLLSTSAYSAINSESIFQTLKLPAKARTTAIQKCTVEHSNTLANLSFATVESTYEYDEETTSIRALDQNEYIKLDNEIHDETRYFYSDEEKIYIARVVYAEARGELFKGQVAVASVVLNRFESGDFGSTVKSVVFARSQFAVSKRYNDQVMAAVEEAIANRDMLPSDMYYFQASKSRNWRNFEYYSRIGGHSFYCAAG